ncbi:hypothetical protein Bca4012_095006 [Brassica carinata]
MDIIKSARNIMALPSVAVPATELQVLVSLSMIPITLLPQAISHGGREAGRAGQSNDSVTIADRSLGQREEAWRPRASLDIAIVFTGGREALAFAAQVAQHPAAKTHKTLQRHFTSVCFLV